MNVRAKRQENTIVEFFFLFAVEALTDLKKGEKRISFTHMWRFVESPLYFIKMYIQKLQQDYIKEDIKMGSNNRGQQLNKHPTQPQAHPINIPSAVR